MNNKALVKMWGTKIGVAYLEKDGFVSFEYDKDFIKSGIQISPLMMPLSSVVYTFKNLDKNVFHGLPGLLYDSLPDKYGNAVIDNYLATKGKPKDYFTIIDRLCYIGERGMGALTFEPCIDIKIDNSELYVDELVEFAKKILDKKKNISIKSNDKNLLNKLFSISSSAGGARAKALIAINKKTKQIKSGQIKLSKDYDYYIIKFDGISNNGDHNLIDSKEYTKIEYIYYLMAKKSGIEMNESYLLEKDGKSHFVTKRFDREKGNKIHMQTYASLAHIDYNTPHLESYEALALNTRSITKNNKDIEQLFRRMIFNVFACNNDDHVKNFSFLMNKKGVWRLSPAYDLTFAYDKDNFWLKSHQMTINNKYENINYCDVIKCGKTMGISTIKADKIINEVKTGVLQFKQISKKVGISVKTINYISSIINKNMFD